MKITIFSFIFAVMCHSVIILLVYACRRLKWLKSSFGWPVVLSLYVLCTIRMFVPIELPQVYIIESKQLYPFFMRLLDAQIQIGASTISVLQVLLILWGTVSAILLIRFIHNYIWAMYSITKYTQPCSHREKDLLNKVMEMTKTKMRIAILYVPSLNTPFGVGIIKKRILLPKREFTDSELHYILLHEYTHFMHHDILLNTLISLFCIVFWWNPIVYLLKQDLEHTLETKCDIAVAKRLNANEKVAYLRTIIKVLKVDKSDMQIPKTSVALNASSAMELRERFLAVTESAISDHREHHAIWATAFTVLVCLSYLFLPQPVFDPPPIAFEFSETSAYLEEIAPSKYELHINGESRGEISLAEAEIYIQNGFAIVKG